MYSSMHDCGQFPVDGFNEENNVSVWCTGGRQKVTCIVSLISNSWAAEISNPFSSCVCQNANEFVCGLD